MKLGGIWIYPIKALDGMQVPSARITAAGSLEGDRSFAIVDENDRFLNGKNEPRVHLLRSRFESGSVILNGERFPLRLSPSLDGFLSRFFDRKVRLVYDPSRGFPDDTGASGPTIVSTSSLQRVADWFSIGEHSARRRFRANLEISATPPFWEDNLFNVPQFHIGTVAVTGTNSCQRCVVPTRDAGTGDPIKGFQKIFMDRRRAELPAWADASRFNHFYRFTTNTLIASSEAGKTISLGDSVSLA